MPTTPTLAGLSRARTRRDSRPRPLRDRQRCDRSLGDAAAARRLRELIAAVSDDGGLIRADPALLDGAAQLALEHGISVYDAAYVAAARAARARLVSCDVADLVSRRLAVLPAQANV